MKFFYALLLGATLSYAKNYMGTIEPVQSFTIFAQSTGEVVMLDERDENTVVNKVLLRIDSALDTLRLDSVKKQLALARQEAAIRKNFYESNAQIAGKSQTEKDTLLLAWIAQQTKVADLELKMAELEDTLRKKEIRIENLYLKELYVNLHDYVTIGTKVANVFDISKGKIVLYVHKDEISDLKSKQIFIDGKPSDAKISKLDLSLDTNYVSSHKVELILDDTRFGRLVNVEFKSGE